MADYVLRFLVGGLVVTCFAMLGDAFRPKSVAGLFGAAPSIALCTIIMALLSQGSEYAKTEGRSMIVGALALAFYSASVCQLMQRIRFHAWEATTASLLIWMLVAIGGKYLLLGP